MKKITYVVQDELGIHARPAGMLVKTAGGFQSKATITLGDKSVDMKRIMALMGLGVKCGDTVEITVEGEDEQIAAETIEKFLKENL